MKILARIRLPLDGQPESQGAPTHNLARNWRRIMRTTNPLASRVLLFGALLGITLSAGQVYAEGPASPAQSQVKLAPIQLSQERSQAIGVTYATVEEKALLTESTPLDLSRPMNS